jgi:Fe-S cluster assembly ATPase SufC
MNRPPRSTVIRALKLSRYGNTLFRDGSSCLMVTHDNRVLDKADRIVSMVDGRIVSDVMVHEQVLICEMLTKIEFLPGWEPSS